MPGPPGSPEPPGLPGSMPIGRSSGSTHTPVSAPLAQLGAGDAGDSAVSGVGGPADRGPVAASVRTPPSISPSAFGRRTGGNCSTGSADAGFNVVCGGNVGGIAVWYVLADPAVSEATTGDGASSGRRSRVVFTGSSAVVAEADVGQARSAGPQARRSPGASGPVGPPRDSSTACATSEGASGASSASPQRPTMRSGAPLAPSGPLEAELAGLAGLAVLAGFAGLTVLIAPTPDS